MIRKSWDMETTQKSIAEWTITKVWGIHTVDHDTAGREWHSQARNAVDELEDVQWKKLDPEGYMVYGFNYMTVEKRQKYRDGEGIGGCQVWGWEKDIDRKRKKIFWGDGNIFYLDCAGGYLTTHLSKLLKLST